MRSRKNAEVHVLKQTPSRLSTMRTRGGAINSKGQNVIDLNSLDVVTGANAGVDVELTHFTTGEELGITIKLLGSDSTAYQNLQTEQGRRRVLRMQKANGKNTTTLDEVKDEAFDLLVACTKGWSGLAENGAALEFTEANVRYVYTKYPWIKEQCEAAVSNRSLFTKA